ncbi:biliverdin-producing heme oxygenase [Pelagibacterium montanilacus]|uniref:biliverdin-producing heme oxygenase n=1 Tax=Pelagibacterium montanilacus TaxID=2185280 RepID=UPI001FE6AD91|nr:biliverdin-producing heme oxygenase [Pelagibacterium montanilacus]
MALRAATTHMHGQLDALDIDLSSRSRYCDFLLWQAGLVPALERHLESNGVGMLLTDWSERSRRDALASDLCQLELAQPALAASLSNASGLDAPEHNVGALWGIAYVLEGSRLGGKMLARAVPETLSQSASSFLSHGRYTNLWPRFVAALDAARLSGAEMAAAIAAANAVFKLFAGSAPFPSRAALASVG